MNIGEIIRKIRIEQGFTQSQVAEKAGINDKYYGKIERNESSPTVNVIESICVALNVDISSLFNQEDHDNI